MMKTLEEVIKNSRVEDEGCIDGRDSVRLAKFFPIEEFGRLGVVYTGKEPYTPIPWTRENILAQLQKDVAFGFEKALNCRGISSSLMFDVVMMWNGILEEGLETFDRENYANYGLPLFKATAVKYGFPNPIGDDTGTEDKYDGS